MQYQLNKIASVIVIGAGVMGSGIAQMFAMAGYKTLLFDIEAAALKVAEKNILTALDGGIKRGKLTDELKQSTCDNLSYTAEFFDLEGDFIIEAIVERLNIKVDLFRKLAGQNNSNTIFATNTSSIPITRIACDIPNPERVVGMHFFNPAHIMKLVEVISGADTHPEVAQLTYDIAEKIGKKAAMAKDSAGFIVNRVARNYYLESLTILEEQIASHEEIDALLESSGFKMGPFKLMDLIGVETNHSVTNSMYNSFFQTPKFRPSRIQQQKVDAGHFGRKTGKGFYNYTK